MVRWKEILARWMKRPFLRRLMIIGTHLIVPKQRVGIRVVIFNQNDDLLLLKHVFHPFTPWGLPGGWLQNNESPADCAKRELWEETGITAVIGPPIRTTYEKNPAHIGIAYLGWAETPINTLSGEILEAKWVSMDNLPKHLFQFTRQAIEEGYQLHCLLKQTNLEQADCVEER